MKASVRWRSRRSMVSGMLLLAVLCFCAVRYFELPAGRLLDQLLLILSLSALLLLPAALLGALLHWSRERRRRGRADPESQSSTS